MCLILLAQGWLPSLGKRGGVEAANAFWCFFSMLEGKTAFVANATVVRFADAPSEVHATMTIGGEKVDAQPKLTSVSGSGFYKVRDDRRRA
jgi:hypothetical protein